MATYSIGTPPTNAIKLSDIQSVFNVLPDNTQKLISPLDVRSAVYTLWENIIFKPTTAGGTEYIGIDQDNFSEKIFFGRKTIGGQYLMNDNLLNTDVDVFFYNTKTASNYDTKIAILAGTSSFVVSGQVSAPYLQSLSITNPGFEKTINFEIINPSYYSNGTNSSGGDINIKSNFGNVSLNGLVFPTYANNNTGNSYEGYVLKYRWIGGLPYAKWEPGASASIDTLFSTGTVSITGSPVLLNGQNINFTSTTPVPNQLGGISAGMTFSNVPVTEMIRMLLYPYISPTLVLTTNHPIIEFGDTTTVPLLNYTITKNSTYSITSFVNTGSPIFAPGLISPGSIVNGITATFATPNITSILNPAGTPSWTQSTWTFNLVDGYPTNLTSSQILKTVLPWYYGTSTFSYTSAAGGFINILGTTSNSVTGRLTPLITEPALTASSIYNKSLNLSGNSVYVYFGYPAEYPDLYQILDQNGFDVTGSFDKFTFSNVTSPLSRWTNRTYKFYIYVGPTASTPALTTIGDPSTSYTETYQFKFA